MKRLLAVLLLAFLTGCSVAPLKLEISDLERSNKVHIEDLRPQTEKEKAIFSYLITSDAYAIYRNGDSAMIPTPFRLLQHKTYKKFLATGGQIDLKIYHLVTYMNAQAALRAGAVGSIFGALGAGVAAATINNDAGFSYSEISREKCENASGSEEYTRAYYSAEENPNEASVYVIYIDAEINGVRNMIRSVSPTKQEGEINSYVVAVERTIETFLGGF